MKPRAWYRVIASAVIILGMLPAGFAQPDQKQAEATVLDLNGTVEAFRVGADDWTGTQKGDHYVDRDALSTDADSWALLEFHNHHQLKMSENTELTIRKLYKEVDTGEETTEIDLSAGEILNRVREMPTEGSIYTIHTPTATSSVRGTRFAVRVYKKEGQWQTDVLVLDGVVEVTDRAGKLLRITDGEQAEISELGAPQGVQRMERGSRQSLQQNMNALQGEGAAAPQIESEQGMQESLLDGVDSLEEQMDEALEDLETETSEPTEIDRDDDNDSDLF